MFKIGELSKITGLSIQAIRFYEEKGLISPIEVDRWTNYRYFDESSIERLSEISYLKDLGFSLDEIKNLDEQTIKQKISQAKNDIKKLISNISKLSSIKVDDKGVNMKKFVNDEKVVGKWQKIAVVKNKEDFFEGNFEDEAIFNINELYFLPKGEEYWIISWTKGFIYLKDRQLPYEIIGNNMFVGIVDKFTGNIDDWAVYEKVDNKVYSKNEIRIKDDTNIPFINDERVVGFWQTVDFVRNFSQFKPRKKFWKDDLVVKKYTFEPDGTLLVEINKTISIVRRMNWSKDVVINNENSTVSEYIIKEIDGHEYMFVEWKSGDYIFGGVVKGYYVFRKN